MTKPNKGRRIACLIMAAGSANRFGSAKQLAELNNQPLIHSIVASARAVFGIDVFCVLGASAPQVAQVLPDDMQVIINPEWQQGLGQSIAVGIKRLNAMHKYDGVLVVLADQYRLTADDLQTFKKQFDSGRILATDYGDSAGVPALFPRNSFIDLMTLTGEKGAKSFLNLAENNVIRLSIPNAQFDIDTREDWLNAIKQSNVSNPA